MEQKNRLEIMKARAKRCVCKYCGGKLELRRMSLEQYYFELKERGEA